MTSDPRWVDVSGLPGPIADAVTALTEHTDRAQPARVTITTDTHTDTDTGQVSRERLGDLIQAAEKVKSFADAALVDATAALVADITAHHGVGADDPRYAAKVAAHRKAACQAVVHEVQLLTGSTITAARDRVRFATALDARVHGAQDLHLLTHHHPSNPNTPGRPPGATLRYALRKLRATQGTPGSQHRCGLLRGRQAHTTAAGYSGDARFTAPLRATQGTPTESHSARRTP
ncbi:hypothetical protein [Flexivirga oryzae]|uniref:DUF222 domain-containing protein n=1 Tax=Flexivirga oryzae TaxID=1794944 RepID=A0A839N8X6_9MICO|nr:hypothetical protein [Flexivirga oryzae]MBB2891655.1 hypothetical protein [Flexivirga oryzae]